MEDQILGYALGVLAVFALVFANGFFVAAEFSLVTVRKTRIDQLIAEGNRMARTVRRALKDPDSYIAATQLGITMASIGLGWVGEPALAGLFEPVFGFLPPPFTAGAAHTAAGVLSFALITALHIVLGELAPKTVALQNPETTALWVAKPTEWFMKVCWPFIVLLNGMGRAVVTGLGFKPPSGHSLVHSEEELKMLVTASQEAGVLEEQEERMLHRVFGFGDLTAGQVMIPRTEMIGLPLNAPLAEVIELVQSIPHPRFPVFRRGPDDVAGFVYPRELVVAAARRADDFSLEPLVREGLTVPETMTADDLLAEMQRHRTHDAIVIDEYGGTAGLVTFETLMERIVGDTSWADDGHAPRLTILADGSALVDGLTLVSDVNERFGVHIDEETYNTIGGYVLGRLGRRARVGDQFEVEGRVMRVAALDGLRVARVFLSCPRPDSVPKPEDLEQE
jgi:CBS domain containing-hemolysin-like protein